jgi:hypothetical protein
LNAYDLLNSLIIHLIVFIFVCFFNTAKLKKKTQMRKKSKYEKRKKRERVNIYNNLDRYIDINTNKKVDRLKIDI